uniref:Uncharacterized protein n=1 Tax=Triticum urartu TaxID=4572 RepID=A0A8R7JWF3_TRIUA
MISRNSLPKYKAQLGISKSSTFKRSTPAMVEMEARLAEVRRVAAEERAEERRLAAEERAEERRLVEAIGGRGEGGGEATGGGEVAGSVG